METTLFVDIETIPSQDPALLAEFRKQIAPPGNIKKQESIEKWLAENADAQAREKIVKTSFDPLFGHICTISWAGVEGEPDVAHARTVKDERDILSTFFASFRAFERVRFVGHNVGAFDIRFMLCRAVVLGLKVPATFPRDPKPWDRNVFDTMHAWAGAKGTVGMDKLCRALGVEGKGDFDGSQVAEAWAAGEHDKIAEYCADDVKRARAVFMAFERAGLT